MTDNRKIVVLHGRSVEDAAAISAALLADRLVLVAMTGPSLSELISQHLVTLRVVSGEAFGLEVCEIVLDRQALTDVTTKLLQLVVNARASSRTISPEHAAAIRMRGRSGEPARDISKYYDVPIETVVQLTKSAA
jgi:hypothetical protein